METIDPEPPVSRPGRRWIRWTLIGAGGAAVVAVIVWTSLVLIAWSRIDRVEFDPVAAREELAALSTTTSVAAVPTTSAGEVELWDVGTTIGIDDPDVPDPVPVTTTVDTYPEAPPVPQSAPVPDGDHQAILIIGSDKMIGSSRRADVIMLALIPSDGSRMMLVSFPRDLYLDDPCGGGRRRINAALNGCGGVSGPNLLAVVVEDFTGIPVDHFVMFDFDGFARVIDVAGGIDVCVDYPTFDTKTHPDLDLPAGCSTLDGDMALSWVRSRKTRQIVDGVEQAVPGVSDYTRQARQRDVTIQMLRKLSGFSGPGDVVSLANAAAGAFTLDSGLSLTGAVGIAWEVRGQAGSVRTPRIPVSSYTTEAGAWVLVPTEPFSATIG